MYRIKRIEIEGVQSYYDRQIIDIPDDSKFIVVTGRNEDNQNQSNGSGKSAIFRQISYCLGLQQRIPKNIISKGKESAFLSLTLYDPTNNDVLKIEREIFQGNQSATLKVLFNGEDQSMNRTDFYTDILENKILGVTYDVYRDLKIMVPETPTILRQTPQKLLKSLEKIFKIYLIDNYYKKTGEKISKLNQEIDKNNLLKERELQEIEQLQRKEINNQPTDMDNDISSIEKEITKLQEQNKKMETDIRDVDLEKIEEQTNKYIKEYNYQESEINQQKKEIKRLLDLKKNDLCPVCHRPIQDDQDVQKHFKELIDQKHKIIESNTIVIKNNESSIKENKKLITEYNEIKNNIRKNNQLIESKTTLISRYKKTKEQLQKVDKEKIQTEIKVRQEKIEKYNNLVKKTKEVLSQYETLYQLFSPKSKIRKELMSMFLDSGLKNLLEYYSSLILNNQIVDYILDQNSLYFGINYINDNANMLEYELLSSGEKRKCDIVFQLQLNNFVDKIYNINFSLMFLDEALDNLDSESQVTTMEALNQYQEESNYTIMITTHKNIVDFENALILDVCKSGNKSNINVIHNKSI